MKRFKCSCNPECNSELEVGYAGLIQLRVGKDWQGAVFLSWRQIFVLFGVLVRGMFV